MRLSLLLSLLLLSSCALLRPQAGTDLVGTRWQIVELQGEPFTAPQQQVFSVSLLPGARLQAYAGCHQLGGAYQLQQGWNGRGMLRLGPFDLLPSLCEPEVAALERRVMHTMEGGSRYELRADGSLVLLNPIGITLLRLLPAPPSPSP